MVNINVKMKFSRQPLKRTPVEIVLDSDGSHLGPVPTNRDGIAAFDIPVTSGKILIDGVERFQGRLEGVIDIELWSLTETGYDWEGASNDECGDNIYPGMTTQVIKVGNYDVRIDSEGYLVNPCDWSEAFARERALQEGLELAGEHWEVIRFQRDWYADHNRQASVRDMIKHFRKLWGKDKGSNRYLHELFPRGGPQKQGNRLAGLFRTKGEH